MPAPSLRRASTVESRQSKEPSPPAQTPDEAIDSDDVVLFDTPAEAPTPGGAGVKQRTAIRSLIPLGIAGTLVAIGIVIMFGIGRVRAGAAVETAQPVVATPAAPVPEVESTPPPTWAGARRTSWAQDGSKTITFTLAATRDLPVWMTRARPVLVVRCLYRATEAFVVLDTSTSYEEDADRRTVHVQWDGGPASTQRWGISESGRELFAPDGIAFVRQLTDAHELRFGFTPFNANAVTAEFSVRDFDQRAALVASTCGWRLD